jgi:hypothetical protein
MMKWIALSGVGVLAAIFAASAPALAFQELPEAPPPEVSYGAAESTPPSAALQSAGGAAAQNSETDSMGLMNLSILPKLDIGLELLYENNQQAQAQDPIADESGDVTVLGKVKRHF